MTDWESVKKFVQPVVAEIEQPGSVLLTVRVVLADDGQETVDVEFGYDDASADRNRRLLEHAARLVAEAAARQRP